MYDMIDPLPGAFRLKMPSFTVAWTVVDLVMVSLRALELPFLLAALLLLDVAHEPANVRNRLYLIIALELASVILIGVSGLIGNIALLCRRHWSLGFCLASSLFTLLSYGILVWQAVLCNFTGSAMVLCWIIIGVTLFIMFRTALLIFDLISLWKAVKFFRERDGY